MVKNPMEKKSDKLIIIEKNIRLLEAYIDILDYLHNQTRIGVKIEKAVRDFEERNIFFSHLKSRK